MGLMKQGSSIITQPPLRTPDQLYLAYMAGEITWDDVIMQLGMVLTKKQAIMNQLLAVETKAISGINDLMADLHDLMELFNTKLIAMQTQDPSNSNPGASTDVNTAATAADDAAFDARLTKYGIQFSNDTANPLVDKMTRQQLTNGNANLQIQVDDASSNSSQQQGTLQRDIGRLDALSEQISSLFQRALDMFQSAAKPTS